MTHEQPPGAREQYVRRLIEHVYHEKFNRNSPFQVSPCAVAWEITEALNQEALCIAPIDLLQRVCSVLFVHNEDKLLDEFGDFLKVAIVPIRAPTRTEGKGG